MRVINFWMCVAICALRAFGQQIDLAQNVYGLLPAGIGIGASGTLPATCTTGQTYFKTNATAGQNWYGCTASNTWTLMSGSPGGLEYTTVTYSATPVFPALNNSGSSFLITLTGNVTSSTLTGATSGQIITLNICQDGSGAHTFVFPTNVQNAGTVDPTASNCTHQVFVFDGTNAQALAPAYVTGASGGKITMPGSSSGATVLQPAAAASGTVTLPAATDTLMGKATTDTLTNKTFDTAGSGNVFRINGTAISAVSGTGAACLASGSSCAGQTVTTGPGVYLWNVPSTFTHDLDFSAWASLKPVYWGIPNGYTSQRVSAVTINIQTADAGKKLIGFFMDHAGALICQSTTVGTDSTGKIDLPFAPCTLTDPNPYFALCTDSVTIKLYEHDSASFGNSASLANGASNSYNAVGTGATPCVLGGGNLTAPASTGAFAPDNAAYHPWAYVHP